MDAPDAVDQSPASWSARLGAWLIDVLLVGAFVALLGDILGLGTGLLTVANPLEVGRHAMLLFVYWTMFETSTGQSPGKLVLDLAVVDADGRTPSLVAASVESFGKAFLLPLDVLIGVLAMPDQGLRLFNRLSATRVVTVDADGPRNRGATVVKA